MSSALPLIVFGHVYFLSNSSLVVHNGPISLPSMNQGFTIPNEVGPVSQVPPIRRNDYTYTPGIGAHKVHTIVTTWHEARQICKQEGGDLAIINSAAEAKIVVDLLETSGDHVGSIWPPVALIGFHDLFKEGQYEAVNGQSLSDTGYNEWLSGEPNGGNSENCGTISRDGKFNDGSCNQPYGYVCELSNPDNGSLVTGSLHISK